MAKCPEQSLTHLVVHCERGSLTLPSICGAPSTDGEPPPQTHGNSCTPGLWDAFLMLLSLWSPGSGGLAPKCLLLTVAACTSPRLPNWCPLLCHSHSAAGDTLSLPRMHNLLALVNFKCVLGNPTEHDTEVKGALILEPEASTSWMVKSCGILVSRTLVFHTLCGPWPGTLSICYAAWQAAAQLTGGHCAKAHLLLTKCHTRILHKKGTHKCVKTRA